VTHPKIVDVLLTPLATQPRLAESTKSVEPHTVFIQSHCAQPRSEPPVLKIVVQVRSAVPGLEQQAILVADEFLQVLCNLLAQVDVTAGASVLRYVTMTGFLR
jgi:hypothetical protein